MNLEHLKAILWLRWRMSRNQWRRAGALNAVVTTVFVVSLLITSSLLFFVALVGGSTFLLTNEVDPDVLMLTWDAIVLVFLIAWVFGLVTELQRSELLSLERFLHLPLSLSGMFVLNYASSLLSLPLLVLLPGMLGLALACVIAKGPVMLTVLPLLASFMLFVTALTYQFRGWLATLMENKRRRKSILVAITVVFVLIMQTPQLLNFTFWGRQRQYATQDARAHLETTSNLRQQMQAGEISTEEFTQRTKELEVQRNARRAQTSAQAYQDFVDRAVLGNKLVPLGWFPYGVRAAAMGNALPGLLASVTLFGIGSLSLRRSYTATLRFYTGTRSAVQRVVAKKKTVTTLPVSNSLESQVPFLSEHVTAVALASFRSLLRAPETKMALMVPVILACVVGGMMFLRPGETLEYEHLRILAPFIAIGIIGTMLFGLSQLMINIFGSDRGAFRAFILMPVPRRDVLIGKNLSLAPIAGGITVVLIVTLQLFIGMRLSHLLATLAQLVPAYLIFCLIGNTASILAPMAVSSGSLKPAQMKLSIMLLQMFFVLLAPLAVLPAVGALAAETILSLTMSVTWLPIYLAVSLLEAVIVVRIYLAVVKRQGDWLQKRETRILEMLASVPE